MHASYSWIHDIGLCNENKLNDFRFWMRKRMLILRLKLNIEHFWWHRTVLAAVYKLRSLISLHIMGEDEVRETINEVNGRSRIDVMIFYQIFQEYFSFEEFKAEMRYHWHCWEAYKMENVRKNNESQRKLIRTVHIAVSRSAINLILLSKYETR